ncbi:MAG: TolC family protein [Spirochaetes bacterium]|nr:TolC family protein [Spirochaetota bacterium]
MAANAGCGKFNIFFILIIYAVVLPVYTEAQSVEKGNGRKITIDDALRTAIKNSYQLKAAALRLESAKAGFAMDLRAFLPSLSVSFGNSDSVIINGADTYSKQFTVKLNQPITTGGRNYIRRTIVRINLLLKQKQLKEQKFSLQDAVWNAFYKLLMNREKAKLQKDAFDISGNQLKIARLEKEQGSITELELLETEIEIKNLEIQIADTELTIKGLEYNLNKLLGLKVFKPLILKGKNLKKYTGIDISNSAGKLYAAALNRNLDIKSLSFELTRSKMELNLIKKRFIPTLNAELSFSVSGSDFPLQEARYGMGLSISFPSTGSPANLSLNYSGQSSGGRSRSSSMKISPFENIKIPLNKKQAEIAVKDANEKRTQFKLDLRFNIERTIDSYLSLRKKILFKRESLALGIRRLAVLKKKLDIGELKRPDFLKEQISLSEQGINYINDVFSLLMAERDIEKLAGLKPGMLKRYAVSIK